MRRPAFVALCAACAVAVGFGLSVERTAVGAASEEQAYRPLSEVPPVERFGQAALDAQSEFIRTMPSARAEFGQNGAITQITGRTGIVLTKGLAGFKVGEPAKELLEKVGPALLSAGTEELRVTRVYTEAAKADPAERESSPERTVRTRQYIRGREVLLSAVNISLNIQTNEITAVVANFLPDHGLPHEPKLTSAEAQAKIEAAMREGEIEEEQKIVFADAPAHLAYAFEEIRGSYGVGGALVWVFRVARSGSHEPLQASVNAVTGEVVRFEALIAGALTRHSYTAGGGAPGALSFPAGLTWVGGEGVLPPDTVGIAAYQNAQTTYNAFKNGLVPSRSSWNNADAPIKLVTHYFMGGASNAFYAPGGYLVFSDAVPGSGTISLAQDLDSVAHEFGHGVVATEMSNATGFTVSQDTVDGAGALNEAYADWASSVVDVYQNGVASLSTWAMATRNPNNQFDSFRSWQAPIVINVQYRDWFPTRSFLSPNSAPGGHYLNSTIMGHAMYLLSAGGQHYRAGIPGSSVPVIPVTGIGYPAARDIFYAGLRHQNMLPTSNYFQLRDLTVASALPAHQSSVQGAWNAVGVSYGCTAPPAVPNLIIDPHYCKGRYDVSWLSVPGATKYHGQRTAANLGWAFAATMVDGNVNSCYQDLPNNYWMIRLRACNGCGCSGWSTTQYLQYYSPCL